MCGNMDVSQFHFDLPKDLIAQTPLADRSASRLLVIDRKTGELSHRHFKDIADYLQPNDCLVINDTKVIPARLIGSRKDTNAKIEILLLTRKTADTWETLVNPGRKAKKGDVVIFGEGLLAAHIEDILDGGNRLVRFEYEGIFEEILDKLGEMPLPPYITEKLTDKNRYQTVYAKCDGSSAAPTAGLHFTQSLLDSIKQKGVAVATLTLHVGLGTFRPVKVSNISEHKMHSEYYSIERSQADIINQAKANGGRIIAVGTTSCRTLEANTDENGILKPGTGWTDIFIYPGYSFKMVDGIITNFHLPESTLIMLVSAFAGRKNILNAYKTAVEKEYRFFSFGDCTLIL